MTIEEKLKLMEEIWTDLIKHEDQISSPLWHKDFLEEREERVKKGQETILDWDEAKERI
jgi:hypothetical protein